ncbi:MAG TPA: hypothetical protein VKH43_14325 [Thermoanaerobaculia bacterium]|nr:hypothetical protein [Thermoanaerobaculia bacterium]
MIRRLWLVLGFLVLVPCLAYGGAVIRSASGFSPASIQTAVDQFRADLGSTNNGVGGTFPSGHREINWDGVPDGFSAPNNLPANFFNVNSPRGVVFSTPGTGFQVSAKTGNPTVTALRFGNLDPDYPFEFQTFSPERLFVALGSNVTDVTFFLPGTNTAAFVSGFGAVFADVDLGTTASLQFFDPSGVSLGAFAVPSQLPGNQDLSFLGVSFNAGEKVARVRIVSGNAAPGAHDNPAGGVDVVAMDDFLYGEPQSLQAGCVGDAATLCLNNGRFRVQATFRPPPPPPPGPPLSPVGQAGATGITGDSGAFSFFSLNNLELLVKVVDGRPFNGKFWVFIGSGSNVEYTVTVTDTTTNAVKTYTNPQGTLASYTDLQAF